MSVDYSGTKPGLPAPTPEEPKFHHMRCKRDGCPSMRVTEVTPAGFGNGAHLYQCVECKSSWGIATGGGVNL